MNAGDKRHADGSPDWAAVEQLFHEATALDDVAREAALAAAGEPTAGIVRRLLAGDADASILDRGIEALAADLIGQESRDALPAERFGPYRVTGLLGRGGMGTVYLAERDDVGSVVALKVLWDAPLSPARRERFMDEQRTLARLRHPCIVPLYDAGVQPDGTAWFAMEHVDGEHVDRWCLDRGTDTPGRLKLFAAICDAVRHAHQRLVVHGDLKPSNILVDGAGRVRLLDFGVAGPVDLVHRTTGAGAITPAYASPALGADGAPTVHSDIYALGVILLQLLTGQWPPLERREPSEIRAVLREARAVQPSNVDWDDLGVICSGALSLDEDTRYQSVEALLHDLERVRAHYPIGADPSLA
ncbi:MAG: serine/threonine protein kinase, partial [Gemmatimonadetes bacterium]|nr:serine/threonine protein kinase [Gemmatimonadota bacterium]